ncbi:hypothetical protein HK096_005924, partial [Nowakowskiella sp. JEL0078]
FGQNPTLNETPVNDNFTSEHDNEYSQQKEIISQNDYSQEAQTQEVDIYNISQQEEADIYVQEQHEESGQHEQQEIVNEEVQEYSTGINELDNYQVGSYNQNVEIINRNSETVDPVDYIAKYQEMFGTDEESEEI